MKIKVLSRKKIRENKYWLIGVANLKDYLETVNRDSSNKFNFEVQRKIVRNIYLDKLIDTIYSKEPIPFITLTANNDMHDNINEITLEHFEILDGLQRTYRLWVYWKIYRDLLCKNKYDKLIDFVKDVKKHFPEFFERNAINSKILKSIFEKKPQLKDVFIDYDIYFTIWTNLTEEEIIKKMLILNAGQKPVSSKHQFELIFLHLLKEIDSFLKEKHIKIYREKDPEFNRIKKERSPGEYAFSTIITSLLSLSIGKPQRVSSELIYRYDLMEEERSLSYANNIFTRDFMEYILGKLLDLDKKYDKDENTLVWLGKDTTLTGIFAAIGKYVGLDKRMENMEFPKNEIISVFEKLIEALPDDLNLTDFNKYYDRLAGRSLNIGTYIRKVVQWYVLNVLEGKKISWKEAFEFLEVSRTYES